MSLHVNITKRVRRRKLASGETVEQLRYVLNWRDPRTGAREQRFFERQKEAQSRRAPPSSPLKSSGRIPLMRKSVTVADAVTAWLETKRGVVRPTRFASYEFRARYVVGPLLPAEARRAAVRSGVGAKSNARALDFLGPVKVQDLTTKQIREWHRLISDEVSAYSANKSLSILKAALALAAEDHEFRPPAMPTGLASPARQGEQIVLSSEQVAMVLSAARRRPGQGRLLCRPFLLGTRPSEQFGLLWDAVDFDANIIRICRIQLKDGTLSELTKTEAGRREIPMSPQLRRCCSAGASAARARTASSSACFLRLATFGLGRWRARTAAARCATATSGAGFGRRR